MKNYNLMCRKKKPASFQWWEGTGFPYRGKKVQNSTNTKAVKGKGLFVVILILTVSSQLEFSSTFQKSINSTLIKCCNFYNSDFMRLKKFKITSNTLISIPFISSSTFSLSHELQMPTEI